MTPFSLPKAILPLAIMSLSACATVPSQSPLMAGIDKAELGKAVPGGLRAADDPVCVTLNNNMANYVPASCRPWRSMFWRALQQAAL